MVYRKDIQILRGVAVLLVVLFHLSFSEFQSGFLGVDVFFVVSGYLMAVLYNSSDKWSFFKRRALRLLPAYFVTVFLTVIVAIFIVTPNEFSQVFEQGIYASVFVSNIGFWMHNGYFSKAWFDPLLHLWSLGVEIQYYLLIPLLFYFLNKGKLYFWLIFFGSLLFCFFVVAEISPKTSFFMMPLRVWEFLIGFGVARYLSVDGGIKATVLQRKIGSAFFLLILAIPLLEVEAKESFSFITGHPGLYALAITLATGVVLAFGIDRRFEASMLGSVLERLGKYSYSIYLVHFPVIVLYLYEPFSGTNLHVDSVYDLIILIAIIVVFSLAMHHWVENRLRRHKKINTILSLLSR